MQEKVPYGGAKQKNLTRLGAQPGLHDVVAVRRGQIVEAELQKIVESWRTGFQRPWLRIAAHWCLHQESMEIWTTILDSDDDLILFAAIRKI
jgi:hypothetical protein